MKRLSLYASLLAMALLASSPALDAQEWISLFDGKTLNGWKANEDPACFSVVDGAIKANGDRCHLFYVGDGEADFKNFEFEAEVMAEPGANSGIFIHTRFQESGWPNQGYEVQVDNSQPLHNGYKELKKTGSLYGIRNVYKQFIADNEWFKLRVVVKGKQVQIDLNSMRVVDYTEPETPYRPGHTAQWVLSHGTFALQSHDPDSTVYFKNLRVKPLPDTLDIPAAPQANVDDIYKQIIELGIQNFPVLDLHSHLKGELTLADLLEKSHQDGIFYGVALNCGKGFPTETDEGIQKYMAEMKDQPLFIGMQAEGREWVDMFSKETIALFDYVFTDSMTFFDNQGRRTRLWIPEEVYIDDKQQFMDMLVEKTVEILNTEPINIYVNPTFLPEVIAAEYDHLWTEARMQKVIDAAVKNHIAIEINSRFQVPSVAFVKLAKQAGCKFTLGTNNGGKDDLGRLEYSLQVVKECKLGWSDMYVPEKK